MQARALDRDWYGGLLQIVAQTRLLSVEDLLRLTYVNREWRRLAISQLRLFKAVELSLHTCQSVLQTAQGSELVGCFFPAAEELTFVNMTNAAFYEFIGHLPRMMEPSKLRRLNLRGLWPASAQRVPSRSDDQKAHMLREPTCPNLETIRLELEYPYNDQLVSWFVTALFSAPQLRQLVWVMGSHPPLLAPNLRVLTAGTLKEHVGIVPVGPWGQHTWRSWQQIASSFRMNTLQSLTVPASLRLARFLTLCVKSNDLPVLKDLAFVNGPGFEIDRQGLDAAAINDMLIACSARPALGLRRLCLVGVALPLACWIVGPAAETCRDCLLHVAAAGHFAGFDQLEVLACVNVSDVGDFLGMTTLLAAIPNLREFVLTGADGWTQFGTVPQFPPVAAQLRTLVLGNVQLQSEQVDALCRLLERGFAPALAELAIGGNAFSSSSMKALLRVRPSRCRVHVDRIQARACPRDELVIPEDRQQVWEQRWFQSCTETAELLEYLPAGCGFLARQQDGDDR